MGRLRLPLLRVPQIVWVGGSSRGPHSPCLAPGTDTRWSCWGSHHCWCCMGPAADTPSHHHGNSWDNDTARARWGSLSTGPTGSRVMAGRGRGLPGQREKTQVSWAPKRLSPPVSIMMTQRWGEQVDLDLEDRQPLPPSGTVLPACKWPDYTC